MIKIKTNEQIKRMRTAGRIAAAALKAGGDAVKPGITTRRIDQTIHSVIEKAGAIPSFLGYGGFPASACISINDEVIHGIPGKRILREGDIVSLDVGACYDGFHGDCAATFGVGEISQEARRLIDVTRQSFYEGIRYARKGQRVSDISHGVQEYAESQGLYVVRKYVGHGVGMNLHEDPEVPNFGRPGRGARLEPGMTLAVEPMINLTAAEVRVLTDGWTVVTIDGGLSAHYEHSILITEGDPELLTIPEDFG